LIEALERANRGGDQTILKNIIERAADPRDFLNAVGVISFDTMKPALKGR
jgi:hypothetical protein